MALIRNYKNLSAPWKPDEKRGTDKKRVEIKKKTADTESHFDGGLTNQNLMRLFFLSFFFYAPFSLPPCHTRLIPDAGVSVLLCLAVAYYYFLYAAVVCMCSCVCVCACAHPTPPDVLPCATL